MDVMNVRRSSAGLLIAVLALVAAAAPAWSAIPKHGAKRNSAQRVFRTQSIDNQRRIDINQLNMFVTNFGSLAYDLSTGNAGLYYPKGTNKTAVYAGGLWLGATVGGETRVTVAEYGQEFVPGPMDVITSRPDSNTFSADNSDFIVYKLQRYGGDRADTAHVERTADELAQDPTADPVVHHSWSEYVNAAQRHGWPLKYFHLNPAAPDDSVLGPNLVGDQMLWSVFNDADPSKHVESAGGTTPLGVEVEQTVFGFDQPGALGNTVFVKYVLRNRGGNQLDNMYISYWFDPDLGGFTDDLVGCDTTLSLGYCYNSTNNDQLYGTAPPAVGCDFFQGPVGLPLTSFNKYINGTDPASADESYNYMQGLLPDGSDLIDPTTGRVTKFFHPGDPTTASGWLDANPADRRFLMSSGPFRLLPGEEQTIVGAIVIGHGIDRLSSIDALKFYDDFAQLAFDQNFRLPNPPSRPKVEVTLDHSKVTLCWDAESRLNYHEPGYAFEGYVVYQGASIAGPWRRLAVYDEVNGILTVRDTVFDFVTGRTITDYPVAFGTDAGIHFCYETTQDAVHGNTLRDGTEYFFAVTAYAVSDSEKLAVVENTQRPIRVTVQRPPSGTDPATAATSSVTYLRKDTVKPPATDVIEPVVVSPELVRNGHIYKVTFEPLIPPFIGRVGQDSAVVNYSWSLTDSTSGNLLLTGQINKRGDEDYRVVDGIQVRVSGAYKPALQNIAYLNDNPAHDPGLEGANFGYPFFNGGGTAAFDAGWSSLDPEAQPDSFTFVEVRFSSTVTQKAYRYFREVNGGSAYGNGVYPYAGFHTVPFTVWDVANDVQLDAGFVENANVDATGTLLPLANQPATQDSTWDPTDAGDGDREYLVVFRRPYSATAKPELAVDSAIQVGLLPVLYMVRPRKPAADAIIDDGDRLQFVWASPATDNDIYVFSTDSLQHYNRALAKSGLERIRAVPNPYYARSRYELSQFNRVMRFVNLPETCTIRIFNLAGDLVRTLTKNDVNSSMLTWDLQTANNLPVGSGVYVYHVDAPGVGTTFGRLVVFMETERLNNF